MKKAWWKECVVYEIYPRSFFDSNGDGIGDLAGIETKLDYLAQLGIDVIWLAPVYKSPNDDNGYDISDYRQIMDEFGTMEDFDRLLSSAHQKGIRIVMDLVANHSSDEHPWFIESRSSRDNDKRDYYFWRDAVDGKEPTNWGSVFGGSAWEWDEKTEQYYLHCFSRKQPDLNWNNPKVREEIYEIMRFWCDKGIDGFRMDVIGMISKKEKLMDAPSTNGLYGDPHFEVFYGPHLNDYLQEMNQKVLSHYDLLTVGECGGVTTEQARHLANAEGTELGMVFQFEHTVLDGDETGKWCKRRMPLPALKENLAKWQRELDETAWNSLFFGNHDQPRMVSRLGDNSPLSAKAIAVAIYSMQGTPFLYQGEELGMTNYPFQGIEDYNDIESIGAYKQLTQSGLREEKEMLEAIAYKSRDNARTPMQWSSEEQAGFTSGTPWFPVNPNYKQINAAAQIKDPDSVYSFYRSYLALRKDEKWKDVLIYGGFKLLAPEDEAVFAYERFTQSQKVLVICNLSPDHRVFRISDDYSLDHCSVLISNYPDTHAENNMLLRPWEASIIHLG